MKRTKKNAKEPAKNFDGLFYKYFGKAIENFLKKNKIRKIKKEVQDVG